MSNVLVTGSSRGLGLELVRQLASGESQGGLVIAAARKCSPALRDLISHFHGSVVFVPLDLTDATTITQSVIAVQSALRGGSLDILINCAGVYSETQGELAHMSDLDYHLSVNVVGTHNVIRQYLPLMRRSKLRKVANISSAYGSLTKASDVAYAPCPAYKISKAALNALTVQHALSYKDDGFIFLAVNPGWLQSDIPSRIFMYQGGRLTMVKTYLGSAIPPTPSDLGVLGLRVDIATYMPLVKLSNDQALVVER